MNLQLHDQGENAIARSEKIGFQRKYSVCELTSYIASHERTDFFVTFFRKTVGNSEFICYFCSDIGTQRPMVDLSCRNVPEYERT